MERRTMTRSQKAAVISRLQATPPLLPPLRAASGAVAASTAQKEA